MCVTVVLMDNTIRGAMLIYHVGYGVFVVPMIYPVTRLSILSSPVLFVHLTSRLRLWNRLARSNFFVVRL